MGYVAINTQPGNCSRGQIRLEGGHDLVDGGTRTGRLEICLNDAWGTVCNSSFNIPDARVACNQMTGFSREGKVQYGICVCIEQVSPI